MLLNKKSITNELLVSLQTKGFLAIAETILEILENENDLNAEQIQYWISVGESLLGISKNYIVISKSLAADNQPQQSVFNPYKTIHLN